ncbi:sensor histidine kinase [Actinomadura scrupuli]|uniref:sensor histidine kinase n=1 Tax=Actinomadura scrupuli TaxID=559629 RepID=UPI003D9552C2
MRMTLAAAAVAALVCVVIGVLVVIGVRGMDAETNRQNLLQAADRVVVMAREDRLPRVLSSTDGTVIQVLDTHGRVVAATPQLAGKPPIASFRPEGDNLVAIRKLCPPAGLTGCMTVVAHWAIQQDGKWVVYASNPMPPRYGGTGLILTLLGVIVLIIAMTGAGAYRLVGKTLAPVDAIRSELAEITATGLGRRVPVPKNHDEIRLLAETANSTLDRLEAAYDQLRQFTSDASHDLRSPITAMRTQLEEALLYPDDTAWPHTATTVLDEVDRLQALVTDLLGLARLDAGVPLTRAPTDVGELIRAELNRRPRSVRVVRRLGEGLIADCDRLRLARLFINLMDNAERHARTQITVIVRAGDGRVVLEVLDDGEGIPADLREVVFQRFTRLKAARERDTGGTGLGLAIARQIAEAHGGTLTVQDSPRGARFVLCLPRSGAAATG